MSRWTRCWTRVDDDIPQERLRTGCRAAAAILTGIAVIAGASSARASPFLVTVDVTGDTASSGVDPLNIFGQGFSLPTAPGAFAYDARFTFDIANLSLTSPRTTLPLFGSYTGMTDATFTALGKTFSLSGSGGLSLSSVAGNNFYSQRVSSGTASLDVSVDPAAADNPITTAGLASWFSYAPPSGDVLTRTIFSSGSASVIANVDSITYSGPGASAIIGPLNVTTGGRTSLTNEPTEIFAAFTPSGGLTLEQAENAVGVTAFNWQQRFDNIPLPSPYKSADGSAITSGSSDPPPITFDYKLAAGCFGSYPFVYKTFGKDGNCNGLDDHLTPALNPTTLNFQDRPQDPCIPLVMPVPAAVISLHNAAVAASCGGQEAMAGDILKFTTTLVGVGGGGNTVIPLPGNNSFQWTDSFNGATGGARGFDDIGPFDPASGTGGIKIVSVNGNAVSGIDTPVPEPSTFLLFSSGIVLILLRRKTKIIFPIGWR